MLHDDPPRSQAARAAAELALVRVVHHYGGRPEFVLLGGLVPGLLCARSDARHAGTTDVDVQVDLEISSRAVNAARLEDALRAADFEPDAHNIWRWRSTGGPQAVIKFELLADLARQPSEAIIKFDGCRDLGAINLPGTGAAASRKTGTTSPSCFCTTTTAAPTRPQLGLSTSSGRNWVPSPRS